MLPVPLYPRASVEFNKVQDSIHDCLPQKQQKNHLIARLTLTLYKNPAYHNWNQLTALEDDLSRVIQIS